MPAGLRLSDGQPPWPQQSVLTGPAKDQRAATRGRPQPCCADRARTRRPWHRASLCSPAHVRRHLPATAIRPPPIRPPRGFAALPKAHERPVVPTPAGWLRTGVFRNVRLSASDAGLVSTLYAGTLNACRPTPVLTDRDGRGGAPLPQTDFPPSPAPLRNAGHDVTGRPAFSSGQGG
jgi:hypothetical protein